ncbi:MAG: carbohydrate ABC transporter permease [Treponema sp.]|nr:carbohydrate ABC transporter permease [Treponema sp.]
MKKIDRASLPRAARELLAIVLFLLYMIPFFIVLINAAKPRLQIITDPLALPTDPELWQNIIRVWEHPRVAYASSFFSSVIITVVSVCLLVLISSMAAWVLVRTKTKLSSLVFMAFVAAMVIPFQVVMFPLVSWFFSIESTLGVSAARSAGVAYARVIFAYLGFGSSLSIFLFHGFIKGIPLELEEAALIDGCTKPQTFFRVVFPLLKPIAVTVIILNGIWIWNDFLLPHMLLVGGPVQTLPLAVRAFVGAFVRQWELILTSTLMAMVPIIAVFLFLQKHIIKGMVEGSIK